MWLTRHGKVQRYLAAGKLIIAALDDKEAGLMQACGAGIACGAAKPKALAEAMCGLYAMTDGQRLAFGRTGQQRYRQHFDPTQLAIALRHHVYGLWQSPAATITG
jgi:hypothetical protein